MSPHKIPLTVEIGSKTKEHITRIAKSENLSISEAIQMLLREGVNTIRGQDNNLE